MKWVLKAFSGMRPLVTPELLPASGAENSINVRLDDGALTPVNAPSNVTSFDATDYNSIYQWLDTWLGWTGWVTAAPGPVAADRLYVFGTSLPDSGAPQMIADSVTYPLAMPAPATALTATVTGSPDEDAAPAVTYTYVYTYLSGYDEESTPCPASDLVSWQEGQTVTLAGFTAPPNRSSTGGKTGDVASFNIYRTETGTAGTALYFIANVPATTTSWTDNVSPTDFGDELPSEDYNPPVAGLQGLISIPNGMMAAFTGNQLWFCEPWLPHAWPEEYMLTTDYPIVALASIGPSVIVLTEGTPYLLQGTTPSAMTMVQLLSNTPCVNGAAVVNFGNLVAFPGPDGLYVIDASGDVVNVTKDLFRREQWQAYNPNTFVAGQLGGRYYATYNSEANGVGTMIVNLQAGAAFVSFSDIAAQAFWYDIESGQLFYLDASGAIHEYDPVSGAPLSMDWLSKESLLLDEVNFSCMWIDAVNAPTAAQTTAINAAITAAETANATMISGGLDAEINGFAVNTYEIDGDGLEDIPAESLSINVNVWADGNIVASVNDDNEIIRLPSGFLARSWQIEVTGTQSIERIALATSVAELRALGDP